MISATSHVVSLQLVEGYDIQVLIIVILTSSVQGRFLDSCYGVGVEQFLMHETDQRKYIKDERAATILRRLG